MYHVRQESTRLAADPLTGKRVAWYKQRLGVCIVVQKSSKHQVDFYVLLNNDQSKCAVASIVLSCMSEADGGRHGRDL